MAFGAVSNRPAASVRGRGRPEDLALLAQLPHLPPQPNPRLALGGGGRVGSTPFIWTKAADTGPGEHRSLLYTHFQLRTPEENAR